MLISNPNKQLSNISILGIHVLSTCRDWKGAALSESHLLLWIFITITSWIPLFWLVYDHPSRNSWFSTTMTQACKLNHHLRYPFSSKPWFWGFGQPVLSNKPSRSAYPFQKPTDLNFWEHIFHRVLRFENGPNVWLSFPDRCCGILQTQLGQTLCDTHGKVHPRFAWR